MPVRAFSLKTYQTVSNDLKECKLSLPRGFDPVL